MWTCSGYFLGFEMGVVIFSSFIGNFDFLVFVISRKRCG